MRTCHPTAVAFEDALYEVSFHAFKSILWREAHDPEVWTKRAERLKANGLLTHTTRSTFKPKEIVVESERLDDPRYRRRLIRELKAPRPSKWVHHEIRIDRAKLIEDENYLADMSKLLAYKWTNKLLPVESDLSKLCLLKLDAEFLADCLDKMSMHQSEADAVAALRLRSFCEEALDKNEKYNAMVADIRKAGSEALAKFRSEMELIKRETLDGFGKSTDRILRDVSEKSDSYMRDTRASISATAEHSARVLEENSSHVDPETEWRETLRRADEKRKLERKPLGWRSKTLIYTGVLGLGYLLGKYLEIEGATPFEALSTVFG